MSKYNRFAKKLNEIASETFSEYQQSKNALTAAEERAKAYPRRMGADPSYLAQSARAEADLVEARNAFEEVRRHLFGNKLREISTLRGELEKALADDFAADPKRVDMQTLELVRSGILTADEFSRLIDSAVADENFTMARLLSKSASDAAGRAEERGDRDGARAFRVASYKGQNANGKQYLERFDYLNNTFARCERNPALSTRWDDLTAEVVENF